MAKKETKENNGKVTNMTQKEFLAFLKRNAGCFTPLNQAAREVVSELSENPE
jgi:hypothetical protein